MIREKLEAHAAVCRDAMAAGRECPRWVGGSLTGAILNHIKFEGANLTGADLTGADLREADLRGADLRGANFRRANLAFARLTKTDLRGTRFHDTNLTGTDLSGADLREADFRTADLHGTNLSGADLRGADLRSTNLRDATLSDANLTGARLFGGKVRGGAIQGYAGGHRWFAVMLVDNVRFPDDIDLQYGNERHYLTWWLTPGAELAVRRGRPPEFWEQGPAVAIAAVQRWLRLNASLHTAPNPGRGGPTDTVICEVL